MKKLYSFIVFLFVTLSLSAQDIQFQCSAPHYDISDLPIRFDEHQTGDRSVVKLQTVVHVIHNTDQPLIDDGLVQSLIQKVNEDFRRQNPDTVDTPDAFKPVAADTRIEFELATVDPTGAPTNGITYTYSTFDFNSSSAFPAAMLYSTGGRDAWNTSKYVNVWLLQYGLGAGVSTTPHAHGDERDGVVVSNIFQSETARFLTHELGHYLGLGHPFAGIDQFEADTCSSEAGGPDGLEDTPNQLHSTSGCPDFPTIDICSPDVPGIMFMNYMDYSGGMCKNLFTDDQAAVMNWIIDSVRNTLLEPVTSVNDLASAAHWDVHVYPNPVNEKLFLEMQIDQRDNASYKLFDSTGKALLVGELLFQEKEKTAIDVTPLANGIYWLEVRSGHFVKTERIVKMGR